ncbi:MAG: hypothetical protein IKF90_21545 [Parasporobacterium sp.]|nr:hypothetical protein [Parasporobacterium sp.]
MNENEKINVDSSFQEVSLEELEEVSGGRIKVTGYALLTAVILQYKSLGKDKEYVIQVVTKSWATDCEFKRRFTDGTSADLQQAIDFINTHWY